MSRGYQNSRSTSIILIMGIFVLLLQGCFKQPLIRVEVSANAITKGCAKDTGGEPREPVEGCPKATIQNPPQTVTNHLGQQLTCTGGHKCTSSSEGSSAPCPRNSGLKCTTFVVGGGTSGTCNCECK